MEEKLAKASWFQEAMKKGLILGVIHIILFLLIYLLIPNKMVSLTYLFIIMVINISYMIYQGILWRKKLGGYIEYGEAYKFVFITVIFSALLHTIFQMIFVIIDPSFPDMMAQGQLDESIYWAQRMGAPEDKLDEVRDKFDFEKMKEQYNFLGMLKSFGIVIIFNAVLTSILTLFIRKRQPETF